MLLFPRKEKSLLDLDTQCNHCQDFKELYLVPGNACFVTPQEHD
jgi:hypothetical protein